MGAIKNKKFRGSEQGYVPMAEYKKMSNSHKQDAYCLLQEQDGRIRPSAGIDTLKDYSDLKRQVSKFPKKVNESLKTD